MKTAGERVIEAKNKIFIGDAIDVKKTLHQALDYCAFTPPSARFIIKPNLVRAFASGSGNITNTRVVQALIDVILERFQVDEIIIAESSSLGQDTWKAFRSSGLILLQGYKDIVSLRDLRFEEYHSSSGFLRQPDLLKETTLINVPVLKGHPQVTFTCSVKNLKGLCCDEDKKNIHLKGLTENLQFLDEFKPHLNVVDATICRYSFAPQDVVRLNRIIVGPDPVLVDTVAASLVGLDIIDIPYLAPLFRERDRTPETNISIKPLASWQPFQESVSFPIADVYLGDACNHCLEAAITCASSPFHPSSLRSKLYRKWSVLSSLLRQKLAPRTTLFKEQNKPAIIIGRLDPKTVLPSRSPLIYAGLCAEHNSNKSNHVIQGCPPSAEAIFTCIRQLNKERIKE